jgi:hypothetical protein
VLGDGIGGGGEETRGEGRKGVLWFGVCDIMESHVGDFMRNVTQLMQIITNVM